MYDSMRSFLRFVSIEVFVTDATATNQKKVSKPLSADLTRSVPMKYGFAEKNSAGTERGWDLALLNQGATRG